MLTTAEILEKALAGERIDDAEGVALLESRDLVSVGRVANRLRARHSDPERITFIVDRNLNYTNICVTDCDFCAFYRRPGDRREGYLLPKPVIYKKIEETLALGGTGLLMQGGHHPDLGIEFYEDLFRSIKERYRIHLHALSPPEIQHISRRSRLSLPEVLTRLRDAGLDSIPGGGGEILVDRVRDVIAPKKTKTAEWLNVMRHAHRLGISTTATMMYGHVETLAERIEHMRRIRDLQDETGGFRSFTSWTFQDDGNRLGAKVPRETMPTSFDYLMTQAVSRIYLDNVPHIQSSWVTQGMKIGQVALEFGADDLGSIMIEENVVSAAGTTYRASTDDFVRTIRSLGKIPVQRDTLYREVRVWRVLDVAGEARVPSKAVVLRLAALLLACLLVPIAAAETTPLVPGVTWEQHVELTPHGPVAYTVITTPAPVGLTTIGPVLGGGTITGPRQSMTQLEESVSGNGIAGGVNGDFFSGTNAIPSGIVMIGGRLEHTPTPAHSSIGFDANGGDARRPHLVLRHLAGKRPAAAAHGRQPAPARGADRSLHARPGGRRRPTSRMRPRSCSTRSRPRPSAPT